MRGEASHFLWDELRGLSPDHVMRLTDLVWHQKDMFIRWPAQSLVLIAGCVRQSYHELPPDVRVKLKAAAIPLDSRSNGPAVMAYRIAGGERPIRTQSQHGWSIHHVYDGKFPAPGRSTSIRAVTDGKYFTATAGLVAVHPIADALAAEVPYFAWLLRHESYQRFGFDPDGVFGQTD